MNQWVLTRALAATAGLATAMTLAGCLATENPDFRSDTPSSYGASVEQSERGATVINRGAAPTSEMPAGPGLSGQ